jgi:hypothetical protein
MDVGPVRPGGNGHDFYIDTIIAAILVHNCPTYNDRLPDAQRDFPNKVGKIEVHHIWPKCIGGDPDGETVAIDAAYHQEITNAFRALYPFGSGPASPEQAAEIMGEVYGQWPLP